MHTIRDLIECSPADDRVAVERLARDPKACVRDYERALRAIPNLKRYFDQVSGAYGGRRFCLLLWFHLWTAIKAEEEIGLETTLDLLRRLPDIQDRVVELRPRNGEKPFSHCLLVLHELVESA